VTGREVKMKKPHFNEQLRAFYKRQQSVGAHPLKDALAKVTAVDVMTAGAAVAAAIAEMKGGKR